MTPTTAPESNHDAEVTRAIEYAERYAGDDDRNFIEALNAAYRGRAASGGERSVRSDDAPQVPDTSFRIHDDPRYLRNARELARRAQGGTRVLGGKPVRVGEFLDCVAVGSDSQWACSGTLIGPNVVLTAGHCARYATRVFFGNDVSQPGLVVPVQRGVVNPQYHQGKHNDLMVLVLAERVTTVAPRRIASKAEVDAATDGRVVGFGNVDPLGKFGYGIKRFVDVPVVSPGCSGKVDVHDDSTSYGCDEGLELVAGRPLLERDSCTGDSGGPFYVLDAQGEWVLGGATSRATASAVNNCGDGGIYVRVDRYRSWIAEIEGVELA